jgi:hypothetical protein
MKDVVAIVGSHPQTRGLFDFTRTDCDIWVFNEAMSTEWTKRADAVFQLHIPTIWRNPNNRNDPNHYAWLKSGQTPAILMQDVYEDVPNSVRFPREDILDVIQNGTANGQPIKEVSCSPAWALAYAIQQGYKKIEVYGVELSSNTEYHYQQGNFKFWLGVAIGKDIDVQIHSTMFDNPQYGYEGEVFLPEDTFSERIQELRPRIIDLQGAFSASSIELNSALERFIGVNTSNEIMAGVVKAIEAAHRLGEIDGAIQENKRYQAKADAMKADGGDFVFSRQEFEAGAAGMKERVEKVAGELQALKGQLDIYHKKGLIKYYYLLSPH